MTSKFSIKNIVHTSTNINIKLVIAVLKMTVNDKRLAYSTGKQVNDNKSDKTHIFSLTLN